jgi:hypothetical protein
MRATESVWRNWICRPKAGGRSRGLSLFAIQTNLLQAGSAGSAAHQACRFTSDLGGRVLRNHARSSGSSEIPSPRILNSTLISSTTATPEDRISQTLVPWLRLWTEISSYRKELPIVRNGEALCVPNAESAFSASPGTVGTAQTISLGALKRLVATRF